MNKFDLIFVLSESISDYCVYEDKYDEIVNMEKIDDYFFESIDPYFTKNFCIFEVEAFQANMHGLKNPANVNVRTGQVNTKSDVRSRIENGESPTKVALSGVSKEEKTAIVNESIEKGLEKAQYIIETKLNKMSKAIALAKLIRCGGK